MDYRYIPFYVQGNAISGLYYGQWEMSEDRDMDYVREMYPMTFSRLQELVEKECNRQEFAGSMMYDEYPDKLGISRIVQNIFNEIKKDEENCVGDECTKYPDDTWLKDIITVLLLNEMYRRRRRRNGRLIKLNIRLLKAGHHKGWLCFFYYKG